MSMYGAAAAKSQNDSAPFSWRISAIATVFDTMPVTFEAAENDPIRSGRSAYSSNVSRSRSRSMWPSASWGMVTTSAMVSRHGHLVGVVLVGTDEHDGSLRGGMCSVRW